MFRRRSAGEPVTLYLDGEALQACAGETVAAAIMASPSPYTRLSVVSGERRAPYCMMGVCFECLVEIDGIPYQQACLTPVRDGMRVRRQSLVQQAHWA